MKKLVSLLLVLCMVLAMTACGAGAPAETPAEAPKQEAPKEEAPKVEAPTEAPAPALPKNVSIELWADMGIGEDVLQNAIDAFEKEYADYGYEVTLNKFAGSQRAALISGAIETNTLPALLFSAWFTTSDYVHQGLVADITDIAESVKDDMYASTYNATVIDGKSYMVGLYQSYFGFIYNADMMKEAGLGAFVPEDPYEVTCWTVDQMENDILPALAEYVKGTEKYPIGFFAADNQADTFMMNWLTMLGGNLWKDGKSVAGEDANTIAALEKMIAWTNAGLTNSNVITKSGAEVGGEFKNQVSVLSSGQFTNYTANLKAMNNGEIEKFDMRIAAIPVKKDGKDTVTMANYVYGASVMNNGKEDQMIVAREFIKWLLGNEEHLTAFNVNAIPCYASITEATAAANPIYAGLAKVEPYIWDFTGGVAGYVSTRSLLFPELQAAFSGEKTAAEALVNYSKGANEVIQEYMDNSLVLN